MRAVLRALVFLVLPVVMYGQTTPSPFTHARHARLFLMCSSCHAGITTGERSTAFPAPALCASCHDGTVQPRVQWAAPAARGAGLLVFSHPAHLAKAKDIACESCHAVADPTVWMGVHRATPERCVSCHAHNASAHLADDNACATCHRPLVGATTLTDARVAGLPQPPSHARADFLGLHGVAARATTANCATCHARESCQRCHVDGGRNTPAILALGPDARVARLVRGRVSVYPTPVSHRVSQFALVHGKTARADVAGCATCHARESCETCHIGDGARDVLRRLPSAREATAPGVQLRHAAPASSILLVSALTQQTDTTQHKVNVHPGGFIRSHGGMARSGELQCASCHAQRFCADCHAGERVSRRYHPNNFISTHAPQAYGREVDCASCHSTEAFCRACHRQSGLAAKSNARSTLFHNAQPLWLLQHGRAARQDLTSCTTCHQQTYCKQCHSDLGARINPHGGSFDAERMSSKNPQLCLICHLKNPLAK
jgi:Cytochrome c7 and related cytochrome c/Doubled CXXCH motif (Paired_CXXCH_1)